AQPVRNSVNSVAMNLVLGGILASMVLFLFLRRLRATMFVAFAIPVSVFFAQSHCQCGNNRHAPANQSGRGRLRAFGNNKDG
ncbi:MAG: efflux RND transporter permease subunit, partial [Desulfobacterales bacterium]